MRFTHAHNHQRGSTNRRRPRRPPLHQTLNNLQFSTKPITLKVPNLTCSFRSLLVTALERPPAEAHVRRSPRSTGGTWRRFQPQPCDPSVWTERPRNAEDVGLTSRMWELLETCRNQGPVSSTTDEVRGFEFNGHVQANVLIPDGTALMANLNFPMNSHVHRRPDVKVVLAELSHAAWAWDRRRCFTLTDPVLVH